ncbi:MAG: RNA methyltransferase [Acidobacteriota bacterium]|nr:RNA methyltransferase [Acidobacteriota bacterium]
METEEDGRQVPAVVLVRPREEGNVGAAARAMANMGLTRLILVEPAAPLGKIAYAFAVGAGSILTAAERAASLREALAPFRRVIATTSTRDRVSDVPLLAPWELPGVLAQDPPGTPTAILFGPEVGGLANTELALASLLVSVPCAPVQPTLNLSQAVLLLAYELYQARDPRPGESAPPPLPVAPPAAAAEIDGLFDHLTPLLGRIGFDRDDSFPGVLRDLRRLASRIAPTSRDVAVLRGICRRADRTLDRQGPSREPRAPRAPDDEAESETKE